MNSADTVTLSAEGTGTEPSIATDGERGSVLELNGGSFLNRSVAVLNTNPFYGKSTENGFTMTFWTKQKSYEQASGLLGIKLSDTYSDDNGYGSFL